LTTAGTRADDESTSSATMNSGWEDSTTNAGSIMPASARSTPGSSSSSSTAGGSETDVPNTLTDAADTSAGLGNTTTFLVTDTSSLPGDSNKGILIAMLVVGGVGFLTSLTIFVLAFLGIICASKPPTNAVPQELDRTLI
ncbi:hypothetical protein AAVH_41452, partial [Aphelenchoides avenae]